MESTEITDIIQVPVAIQGLLRAYIEEKIKLDGKIEGVLEALTAHVSGGWTLDNSFTFLRRKEE